MKKLNILRKNKLKMDILSDKGKIVIMDPF